MRIKLKARIKEQTIQDIPIYTDFIKLDAFLKFSNLAETGGMAKRLIEEGRVLVNGEVCDKRGKKLYPGDTVELGGSRLRIASE